MKERLENGSIHNVAGGGRGNNNSNNLESQFVNTLNRYEELLDTLEERFQEAVANGDYLAARVYDNDYRQAYRDRQELLRAAGAETSF